MESFLPITASYLKKDSNPDHVTLYAKFLRDRVMQSNLNFMCCVTGATGSGKSYSSIALSEIIDKRFTIDNIVFSQKEFVELLNSGKLKRGACIVYDEIGATQNARNWHSQANKFLNNILMTFRTLNLIVFFTVPAMIFVDKQARMLFHAQHTAMSWDRNNSTTKIKPLLISYNQTNDKIYMKFLKVGNVGHKYKLPYLDVPRMSKELEKAYTKKREEYVSTLRNLEALKIGARVNPKPETKRDKIIRLTDVGLTTKEIAIQIGSTIDYVAKVKSVYLASKLVK